MAIEYILLLEKNPSPPTEFLALLEQDVPNSSDTDLAEASSFDNSVDLIESNSFENQSEIFIDYTDTTGGFLALLEQDVPNSTESDAIEATESLHSNDLSISLLGSLVLPPNPPTGLIAFPCNSEVVLDWDDTPGATSYKVYRSLVSGSGYVIVASGLPTSDYVDLTVTNGIQYFYVVTAVGASESFFSSEIAVTPNPPIPAAPTGLVATPGLFQIGLTWSAPPVTNPGYGFDYGTFYGGGCANPAATYKLKRSLVPGGPYTTIQTGIVPTSFVNLGLTPGVPYYYVVSGVNSGGEGPDSAEASAIPFGPLIFPYVNPRTPFEVIVMFDFQTEELSIDAILKAFPMKSYADVTAPPGLTNLTPIVGQVQKPRALLVWSKNQALFDINPGGGFAGVFASVYFLALQQTAPASLSINCVSEADLRIIVAGDP